jgi:hypothetical protein
MQIYENKINIPNFFALQALQEPIIWLFQIDFITLHSDNWITAKFADVTNTCG